MIPRIIHYCWFGPNKIPEQLLQYMESWKLFCPDYEIKLWNEKSFDIKSHPFTLSAYNEKKYAYVSDYVRAYALYNFGGIYLDTDVELKESLDIFLQHEAFTGFEGKGSPFTAVWGSIQGHSLTKEILEYYQGRIYTIEENTNTFSVTGILKEKFFINPDDNILQIGNDSINTIHIYPSTHFCLDLPKNFATHHFYGSWLPNKTKSYKENASEIYFNEQLTSLENITHSKSFLKTLAANIDLKDLLKIILYFLRYKVK
ncbi:glycosyltransferase family 32 protein [Acinetobacter radioresistens]|uniref:glycosyltransferase family 32 protein n=1 Tax=Acinetobacter radioresistens TaxID=40216 RepID=UPI000E7427F5|nr:glycosyltransferase [Acinetobacter radioresistens]RJL74336.1 glycosyl transferase [Acinetobacter radioresistens]